MCLMRMPKPQPQRFAATDNSEASRQASLEMALRRRRRGAAADILTSPVGLPGTTASLGEVAA